MASRGLLIQVVLVLMTITTLSSACHRLPEPVQVFEGGTADFICSVSNHSEATEGRWSIYDPFSGESFDIAGKPSRDVEIPSDFMMSPHGRYSALYRFDRELEAKIYRLYIENVTIGDGLFQFSCSLWNQTSAVVQSDLVDLTVLALPQIHCSVEPQILSDNISPSGVMIELTCWASGNGLPPVNLTWYSNGRQVASQQTGTNYFTYLLTPSDAGREFRCRADIDTLHETPSCAVTPLRTANVLVPTFPPPMKSTISAITARNSNNEEESLKTTKMHFGSTNLKTDKVNIFSERTTKYPNQGTTKDPVEQQPKSSSKSIIILVVVVAVAFLFLVNIIGYCFSKGCPKTCKTLKIINFKTCGNNEPENFYANQDTILDSMYEPIDRKSKSLNGCETYNGDPMEPEQMYHYISNDQCMFNKKTDFNHRKSKATSNFYEDIQNDCACDPTSASSTKSTFPVCPIRNASQPNTYEPLQTDNVRQEQSNPSFYTALKE